ncbi:MAG: LLM class flavin-dependent oxidoreductase [Deltaproteobacteria bacterium]|nr:LLM class flavin-dependent oxidoreductase [Deltaproteobacteria bacterium]
MAEMRFGIQLFPWCTAPEMVAYAKRALSQHPFDKVWVPDHLSYENVFVTLASLIMETSAHVGTSVAQPFSRTPVDLASSFAALSHLAGERGITVGIGSGAVTSDMIRKRRRVTMVREMLLFLRELFAGRKVILGEFPNLVDFFRLDATAETLLRVPPVQPPEIFVAAAGPQMLRLAGELGDGLILSNFSFPTALIRRGVLDGAMAKVEEGRRSRGDGRPFTKVLHLHVSVARDGRRAKNFSKRLASIALARSNLGRKKLIQLGFPAEEATAIENAYHQGMGADDMEPMVSDQLIEESGIIAAGTPEQCISQLDELLRLAKPHRFDIVDMATPLGPDLDEAIDILCQEILPELQRRSDSYQDKG